MGTPVKLTNVTICYPHLLTPHKAPGSDKLNYSVEVHLDPNKPTDVALLNELEAAFRAELTGAGKAQAIEFMERPFKAGDSVNAERAKKGKGPRPEIVGKYVMRAATASQCPVVDRSRQPILDATQIFGGCICHVAVDLYWFSNATNPGVFCGLNGVQLISNVNVTPIGGGSAPSAEELFDVIEAPAQQPAFQTQQPAFQNEAAPQPAFQNEAAPPPQKPVSVPPWMA